MSGTEAYERLGAAIVEQACKDVMRNPGEVRRFFCDNKSIFDLCMPTADGKRVYEQIMRNYAHEGHFLFGRWEDMIMGLIEALFEVTDERLQALYHRAWLETNRGFVDSRKFPDLDKALYIYAKEHNCSYDEAFIFAKTGKKMGRLANS